jgi:hypothetical protein
MTMIYSSLANNNQQPDIDFREIKELINVGSTNDPAQ